MTPPTERVLRSDAERNRRRVLDAAQALFRERGLDVGVAEIAQRAGVGRGTLFRNFPTKQDLIAAIVIERMHEATVYARTLLDAPDPGEALFGFLEEMVGPQQLDRARGTGGCGGVVHSSRAPMFSPYWVCPITTKPMCRKNCSGPSSPGSQMT